MIQATQDYDKFIFRDDNREAIRPADVDKIVASIQARNLLEFKPIQVNEDFEILDGQHRLLAAKRLGVPIYYKVESSLKPSDIIVLNVQKNWTTNDYINFYCKNGYIEYLKLKEFLETNNLSSKIALNLLHGTSMFLMEDFKQGRFVFNYDIIKEELDICWDTVNYLKSMNGCSHFLMSAKFWKAMLKLSRAPTFMRKRWMDNLKKFVSKVTIKATTRDYLELLEDIYNYRGGQYKVSLVDE